MVEYLGVFHQVGFFLLGWPTGLEGGIVPTIFADFSARVSGKTSHFQEDLPFSDRLQPSQVEFAMVVFLLT